MIFSMKLACGRLAASDAAVIMCAVCGLIVIVVTTTAASAKASIRARIKNIFFMAIPVQDEVARTGQGLPVTGITFWSF
jgi:hypothetical protein